jgi:hypothetical protein
MEIRGIIRHFIRWQIANELVDELTIDYEMAETYLEEPEQVTLFAKPAVGSAQLFSSEVITKYAEEYASKIYPNPTFENYLDKNAIKQAYVFGAIKLNEIMHANSTDDNTNNFE